MIIQKKSLNNNLPNNYNILDGSDIKIILKFIDGEKTLCNGEKILSMYKRTQNINSNNPFMRYVNAYGNDNIEEYIKAKNDIKKNMPK